MSPIRRMNGTQHPTLTRLTETNMSCSSETCSSSTIHSEAGPSSTWGGVFFAFERLSTRVRDYETRGLTMNLSICAHTLRARSSILNLSMGVFICVTEVSRAKQCT